ncbi:MAG TPA: hypothetical protein VD793_09610 [Gemmatimonadales bacterium]|nr:hypothetical protein [Gemmatimonadales bacterium]
MGSSPFTRHGRYATVRQWAPVVGLLLAGWPRPGWAQDDTLLAPAVIQLNIHQGPVQVIAALTYNSTLLIPIRTLVELTELRLETYAAGDSVVIVLEPSKVPVRFVPARRQLLVGDSVLPLGPYDAVWADGDMFVATKTLDHALGTATSIAWANLSALVGQTASLPVVRRGRRERRRQQMVVSPTEPAALLLRPAERVADGAVVSWSLFASTRSPADDYSIDLGIGGKLYRGSLELRPRFRNTSGTHDARLEASWARAWTDRPWLSQARLGSVASGGRRSRLIHGLVVTNAPFVRSSEFEVEQLAGTIPPGWEIELYERGRLLAYEEAGALGAYQMPLKLRYGQNPYELVLYGPAGEVVRQRRTVRVPFSRLPEGRWEYAVAGGACRFDPCDGLWSADVRYGLSGQWTVQGGWDAFFRGGTGDIWQPYVVASGSPIHSLGVTGEAVLNGHLRAQVAFEPHEDLRIETGHTGFATGGLAFAGTYYERRRTEASLFWHPPVWRGSLFVQASGVRSSSVGSSRAAEQVTANARVGKVRYSVGVKRDAFRPTGGAAITRLAVELGGDGVLNGPWRWIRRTTARAVVGVEPSHGLSRVAASLGRKLGDVRVDLGLGWTRLDGATLDLGLTSALRGRPRVGTRNRFGGSGSDGLMFVSGSAAWDPDTRLLRWSDGGDLGRGGITGVVFLDQNGNGLRDASESGLANVPVRVGGWYDETDQDGRFVAWDLFPYESVKIEVDSLSFEDPRYILPARILRVRPAPNSFLSVEVPVTVGAELGGFVFVNGSTVGGVPVIFRELETGLELTGLTFADGAFYRTGVPPGEWEITLSEAVAEHLNVTVPPLHIFIPPGSGDKRFEDLILRLEPR